jgi:hypothetical protein
MSGRRSAAVPPGRHDEGVVLPGSDLDDGLQQLELQGGWAGGHHSGCLASFFDAWHSPSAEIIRARPSRLASAWRGIWADLPLPEPASRRATIGELLARLEGTGTARQPPGQGHI